MASSMPSRALVVGSLLAALALLVTAGCAAPALPAQDTSTAVIPPPAASAAPTPSAELSAQPAPPPPSAVASASVAPATPPPPAMPAVDRNTCQPHPPAVAFEVTNDDVVVTLDARGCPTGGSHFKANGYGYQASVDFMTELQRRLKAGDKAGVADLANFPLRVNGSGSHHVIIKDRAAFLKSFDQIYSPAVISAVLVSDPRDLFCNYQGIMLGNGILWADKGTKGHYGTIAINVP